MSLPTATHAPHSPDPILAEIAAASGHPVLDCVLKASTGLVAILNTNRQVLVVNDSFLKTLGIRDGHVLLGLRPGDVLGCIHRGQTGMGCGTTPWCATCGLAISIVASLAGEEAIERRCALSSSVDGQVVERCFAVRSNLFALGDARFILVFLQDITEQERRAALERVFLHDINNIVMGLYSSAELLKMENSASQPALAGMIGDLTARLRTELSMQASLLRGAADPVYRPRLTPTTAMEVLEHLSKLASPHRAAAGRKITIPAAVAATPFATNSPLLVRVLLNMTVNALEATPEGGEIRIHCETDATTIRFSVWNQGAIPPTIARRVFQQFFSTKPGSGRGFGTFSTRLIGEQYLGGAVGFQTSTELGTTFHITLPR